jgi:hypothetical protein
VKCAWLAAAGALLSASALAQTLPLQEQGLPPLQKQWQGNGQAPVQDGMPIEEVPSGDNAPVQQTLPTPPSPDMTPIQRANVWVPAAGAKLQALDKVNAQATAMTVKVGQSATFGSLTITVKACVVRPPDQPADAAAYLDVTDSHPDSPPFNGWLLWHEPAVSMMEHPIYDIRVAGCT